MGIRFTVLWSPSRTLKRASLYHLIFVSGPFTKQAQYAVWPSKPSSSMRRCEWALERREKREKRREERDGIRLGDYREQREVLWFLDWFQRMYVSLQRTQGLLSSPRRLSRVPSPFQRGLFSLYLLQFYSFLW